MAMAMLSERLNDHKSAIAYYNEITGMSDDEQSRPEILMKIAENQVLAGNFLEAISLCEIIRSMPGGKEIMKYDIHTKALI